MKLLKLPYLAQLEVYKQFHPLDYFLFSFCSKHAATRIKIMKYPKAQLFVTPLCTRVSGEIVWQYSIKSGDLILLTIGFRSISEYEGNVIMLDIGNQRIPVEVSIGMLISNTEMEINDIFASPRTVFRKPDNGLVGYGFTASIEATRVVQKQICDIFSLPSRITFEANTGLDLFEHFIPNSIRTTILHKMHSVELAELFYNFHSDQELLVFSNDYYSKFGKCSQILKIFQVKNLLIWSVNKGIKWYMSLFQGTNGLFDMAHTDTISIGIFLSLWKQKTNDPLETFIAYQEQRKFINRIADITNGLEPWDTEKHGKVYPYDSIISEHHEFNEGTFNCQGGYFIRRETDGRVATLKLTPNYFMFFVWK